MGDYTQAMKKQLPNFIFEFLCVYGEYAKWRKKYYNFAYLG
jgi:hypothetical protein